MPNASRIIVTLAVIQSSDFAFNKMIYPVAQNIHIFYRYRPIFKETHNHISNNVMKL